LARAALKNFFAAIDWVVQTKLFVSFSFFSSSPAFSTGCFSGKKNEKFGLNSASKRPH
jgi:hypothetical protein